MSDLARQSCVPCRGGEPPLKREEIVEKAKELPEWEVREEGGVAYLHHQFTFKNFAQALAFTDAVGHLAEQEGHHPRLVTEWGKVAVEWWTHKIQGLHNNDFVMAAKTEELYHDR